MSESGGFGVAITMAIILGAMLVSVAGLIAIQKPEKPAKEKPMTNLSLVLLGDFYRVQKHSLPSLPTSNLLVSTLLFGWDYSGSL